MDLICDKMHIHQPYRQIYNEALIQCFKLQITCQWQHLYKAYKVQKGVTIKKSCDKISKSDFLQNELGKK